MRLGRETGSLTNWALGGTNGQPTPEVGMGVTVLHWTDRSAGTVSRVSQSGKTFWFRADRAMRVDSNGMSELQAYRYEPQPDAPEQAARRTKDGAWKSASGQVRVGERMAYRDYTF